jgi:predicted HAD superfamily Cof-like phosphohydrolase
MSENKYYHMVREFHKSFNHMMNDKPTELPREEALNRASWIGEELVELLHATANNKEDFYDLFDSFVGSLEKTHDKLNEKPIPDNKIATQVDALVDAEYFVTGGYVCMGVEPDNIFSAVQKANMDKLWEDGKPRHREGDGKIMKPPTWKAPDEAIEAEIKRQMN